MNNTPTTPIVIEEVPLTIACPCGGAIVLSDLDFDDTGHGPCTHCTTYDGVSRDEIPG
jgi:hypothetical protein